MGSTPADASSSRQWSPSFRFGKWPAVGLVLAFTVWVLISAVAFTSLFGEQTSQFLRTLWSIPSGVVQFGIVAAVYRYDGVTFSEIGLSKRLVRPAAIAVGGVIIVTNVVVFTMALLAGNQITFGIYEFYQSDPFNFSSTTIALGAATAYLFTGPIEELAFRGYLQNKVITLLNFDSIRARTSTSIVVTAVVFSVLHIPVKVLVDGAQVAGLVGTLVLLALSGMIFGTIYALTQNLYLVIFLHGIGNFWPLMVDPGQGIWPNYLVLLLIYLALIVVYRQVATRTSVPTPSFVMAD
ncbi:MAG: lysostaphin resistance A-like protein [Halobacteriales archaeon]